MESEIRAFIYKYLDSLHTMKKFNTKLILFSLALVAVTTLVKYFLGPDLDWSGFSPVIAIALFAGMIIPERRQSFIIPLMALLLSDVIIHILYLQGAFPYAGFYEGQWVNYLLLLLMTGLGWWLKGRRTVNLLVAAVAAPTIYFLLSNLSVWIGSDGVYYSKDLDGLISCYTLALPFYKNTLLATVLFLPAILLTYNMAVRGRQAVTLG